MMALTWKAIKKRWLPLVEEMERLGFEDYAEPEIYRAAEAEIAALATENACLLDAVRPLRGVEPNHVQASRLLEWAEALEYGYRGFDDAIREYLIQMANMFDKIWLCGGLRRGGDE